MKNSNLPFYHILQITGLAVTNHKPFRIKIRSDRFSQTKIIDYSYEYNDIRQDAIDWLESKGFEIVGSGEIKDGFTLISTTFEPLDIKKWENR